MMPILLVLVALGMFLAGRWWLLQIGPLARLALSIDGLALDAQLMFLGVALMGTIISFLMQRPGVGLPASKTCGIGAFSRIGTSPGGR